LRLFLFAEVLYQHLPDVFQRPRRQLEWSQTVQGGVMYQFS
jgi:hypothetical protein